MFDIGPEKLLLILVIALVFLGPQKLPEIARSLGKGLREFRQVGQSARQELLDGFDTDTTPPVLQGPIAQDATTEATTEAAAVADVPNVPDGLSGSNGSNGERPDIERTGPAA